MKVLFDYQAFEMQTHGGVSRCFSELCFELRNSGVESQIGIRESSNVYLKEKALVDNLNPLHYLHDKFYGPKQYFRGQWWAMRKILSLWGHNSYYLDINKQYCIELLNRGDFDVFHPTYFDSYFLPHLHNKPFVLTIHDMIPELYPQYFPGRNFQVEGKKVLAPLANAIVVVSENTKEDVVRLLDVPEEKVHVIYHGSSFALPKELKRPYEFRYLLYVGGRFGYKDFDKFLMNVTPTLNRHQDMRVVCTGRPFNKEEISLFESLGIGDRMIHNWAETDNDLYILYHYAECFVYSSEYEGFGIPILEAYAADCPVLLNNASCFPEIAGDAAEYFSFDSLTAQLEKILSFTPIERASMLSRQRDRLALFSWKESARNLRLVYESIL